MLAPSGNLRGRILRMLLVESVARFAPRSGNSTVIPDPVLQKAAEMVFHDTAQVKRLWISKDPLSYQTVRLHGEIDNPLRISIIGRDLTVWTAEGPEDLRDLDASLHRRPLPFKAEWLFTIFGDSKHERPSVAEDASPAF